MNPELRHTITHLTGLLAFELWDLTLSREEISNNSELKYPDG